MILEANYKFVYNDEKTYGNNFLRWRARNNEEKLFYGQEKYTLGKSKQVFDSMYSEKKVKENE